MSYAWIIVADAARARVFSTSSPKDALEPLHQLLCPEARLHERDLTADKPGRSFDSAGDGRHATAPATGAKRQLAIRFAAEVADCLEHGRLNNDFERLVIVAEPQFLGLLCNAVKPAVAKLITQKIDKDLSKLDHAAIRKRLPERI